MKRHVMLWALIPLFNTLYQVFIKLAAHDMVGMDSNILWLQRAATTPFMWAALLSEIASFAIWMHILSNNNLSKAFPLSAISYALILYVSWSLFHEDILPLQLLGSTFILAGVWMIGTAETHQEAQL